MYLIVSGDSSDTGIAQNLGVLRIQPSQSHAQHVSAYRALVVSAISLKPSLDSRLGPFWSGWRSLLVQIKYGSIDLADFDGSRTPGERPCLGGYEMYLSKGRIWKGPSVRSHIDSKWIDFWTVCHPWLCSAHPVHCPSVLSIEPTVPQVDGDDQHSKKNIPQTPTRTGHARNET